MLTATRTLVMTGYAGIVVAAMWVGAFANWVLTRPAKVDSQPPAAIEHCEPRPPESVR